MVYPGNSSGAEVHHIETTKARRTAASELERNCPRQHYDPSPIVRTLNHRIQINLVFTLGMPAQVGPVQPHKSRSLSATLDWPIYLT
jgi:hypothetical protein